MSTFRQRRTALLTAFFVVAMASAFFFHDSHDRITAETCHFCHICKVSHAATDTLVAAAPLILTVERDDGPTVVWRSVARAALPSARAPPAA